MSEQPKTRKNKVVNCTNYPYFKKQTIYDPILGKFQDLYTLLSIARNNIFGVDIYLHYFPSIYSRRYSPHNGQQYTINKFKKQDLSQFFIVFIKILILRSFIGKKVKSGIPTSIVNDLFDPKDNSIDRFFSLYLKSEISYLSQEYDQELYKNNAKFEYLEQSEIIQKKIQAILDELYNKTSPQRFHLIKERQYLPDRLNDQQLIRYIKSNFQCICNIHSLRRSNKKEIWQQFQITNRNYIQIKMDFLSLSKQNPKVNQIILPRISEQSQPILTSLLNYLQSFKNKQGAYQQQVLSQRKCLAMVCKNLLAFCTNYNKQTKGFFPNLSIHYMIMDQKKLVLTLLYNPLLIDGFGFCGNTKNFELKLATEPTPQGYNPQKTYLQFEKKHLLNKKYYCSKKKNNEDDQIRQEQDQDKNIKKILEEIHVEKLIRTIYFIQRQRHFTNDYYYGKFTRKRSTTTTPKPFYIEQYRKNLKNIYEEFSSKSLQSDQIIEFPTQEHQSKANENVQMDNESELSFDLIKRKFGCEAQDSLLQVLTHESIQSYLYHRIQIFLEINLLILGKQSFKNLPNPKKYILLHCASKFQELELFRAVKSKEKLLTSSVQNIYKKKEIYQSIKLSLGRDIFNVNFNKQMARIKKIKKDAQNKLIQYQGRSDSSGIYVKGKREYYEPIKKQSTSPEIQLYQKMQNVIQRQIELICILEEEEIKQNILLKISQNLQKIAKQLQYFPECAKIRQKLIIFLQQMNSANQKKGLAQKIKKNSYKTLEYFQNRVEYEINFSLNKLKIFLKNFIDKQIEDDFDPPIKLHISQANNPPNQMWIETCNHFNAKFTILMTAFYYLNENSFLRYESILKQFIFHQNIIKDQQDQLKNRCGQYRIAIKNMNQTKQSDEQLERKQKARHQRYKLSQKYFQNGIQL